MSIKLGNSFVVTVEGPEGPSIDAHTPNGDFNCNASHVYLVRDTDIAGMSCTHIKAYCRTCREEASFLYEKQDGNLWVLVED